MLSGTGVKLLSFLAIAILFAAEICAQDVKAIADKDGVYITGKGLTPALMLHAVPAVLPDSAQSGGPKHACAFVAVINADGKVGKLVLANRIQSPFDDAAFDAVRQSTFQPGTLDGKAVPTQMMVYVPFLGDGSPAIPSVTMVPGKKPQFSKSFKPPVPISTPEAEFSDQARREHFQGTVLIRVLVDEDGLPRLVTLLAGPGRGLNENAVAAVRKYKFKPGTFDDIPIPFLMNVQVNFRM